MIQSTLEVSLLILCLEFGLLSVTIAFISYRGARTSDAETTADATALVSQVADTEDARKAALEMVFKEKYQYEGDELTGMVEEFMQREKAFYNAVVGAFLGRAENKISDLNDELTKVVAPWISITPKNMVDASEAQSLTDANASLENELGETKSVLEKMISEYNRAFHIAQPEDASAELTEDEPTSEVAEQLDETDDVTFSVDLSDDSEDSDAAGNATSADEGDEPAESEATASAGDIEELDEFDEDDDLVASAPAADETAESEPAIESQDATEGESVAAADDNGGEKPMTADDLDDLMESLEAEPEEEAQPA